MSLPAFAYSNILGINPCPLAKDTVNLFPEKHCLGAYLTPFQRRQNHLTSAMSGSQDFAA